MRWGACGKLPWILGIPKKKKQSPEFNEDLSINRKDLVFNIGDRIHPLFLSPFIFRESGYNEKKKRDKGYIDI